MVSILGTVIMVLGIYSVFGYLDPLGQCLEEVLARENWPVRTAIEIVDDQLREIYTFHQT